MKVRNQEMEYYMYACDRSQPMFQEIAKELRTDVAQTWDLSLEDLRTCLTSHSPDFIKSFVVGNQTIYRLGHKMVVTNQVKVKRPELSAKRLLNGDVVFGEGSFKAKVKLAFSPEDLQKISPTGQPIALVTGMTSPDFIPFMSENVGALITDEGGILCHAAIVAREMNIPCIVGTSDATEKLKDGMEVMIDFDQGTVEPIEDPNQLSAM